MIEKDKYTIGKDKSMIGIYFSGTGNSKYCVEKFLWHYGGTGEAFAIEDAEAIKQIISNQEIVFAYPVQFSNVPKIVKDFIIEHKDIWKGKRVFVIATMGLFSGDGAGVLGRLLEKYGAVITGGLHLKMPDSISDEKALKRPLEKNKELVVQAEQKIVGAVKAMKAGKPTQEGIGIWYRLAGLFGQRLYFYHKTRTYTDKLKIDSNKCVGCGKCEKLCPMRNISMKGGKAVAGDRCTMCYRCIGHCPKEAITLLGKKVQEQCRIERYR